MRWFLKWAGRDGEVSLTSGELLSYAKTRRCSLLEISWCPSAVLSPSQWSDLINDALAPLRGEPRRNQATAESGLVASARSSSPPAKSENLGI